MRPPAHRGLCLRPGGNAESEVHLQPRKKRGPPILPPEGEADNGSRTILNAVRSLSGILLRQKLFDGIEYDLELLIILFLHGLDFSL